MLLFTHSLHLPGGSKPIARHGYFFFPDISSNVYLLIVFQADGIQDVKWGLAVSERMEKDQRLWDKIIGPKIHRDPAWVKRNMNSPEKGRQGFIMVHML